MADSASRVSTISDFVLSVLERQPERLSARVPDPAPLCEERVEQDLDLAGLSEDEAMRGLRRFRHVEMARIAWRDFAGWDNLETSLRNLSFLAEQLIVRALDYAIDLLEPRFGRPLDPSGVTAPLLVLAMGKLGGRELNFSSDVDLVFLYPDDAVAGERSGTELQPYYLRLAHVLIKLLDQRTEHGFVFRTDARLRPFGASGPLVVSIAAFESYLISNGRDWERYAYQKARLLTGTQYQEEVFDQILVPYVYRGYLDYGVFDALRQMKRLIRQEVARRELQSNVKLGPGGIREIEFVVQAFQLVRGGRDPSLRGQSLLPVLPRLVDEQQLDEHQVAGLGEAYRYLRCLENRIQAIDDRQTHNLPETPEMRARVAYAMGEPDWDRVLEDLNRHRAAVESAFDKVARYSAAAAEAGDPVVEAIRAAWDNGNLANAAAEGSITLDEESVELLDGLRNGALYQRMDEVSRRRLAAVIARTVQLLQDDDGRALVFARLLPVYQAICRRSAYLALLDENPATIERLIILARRSALLCRQLADQPILLDELLDPRIFDTPPTREEFRALLAEQLRTASGADVEASLDAMRQFHSAAIFRTAIADTLGQLPLMKVSDRLTDTAELVVQFALDLAQRELVERYGCPMCGKGPERREAGFAVIAYGKLAGLELGYGSDLDLVFLHDSSGPAQQTDGEKSVENAVFFARLAQRLLHFLSIQTVAGRLYEIDTRLRPSGNSGLLVASMDNFRRYQRQDAWVWEHQALLRSRAIAGSASVCAEFERERLAILVSAVDREHLRDEVVKMRLRMRKELSKSGPGQFDLKQDEGGLADIEFLVDYLVLSNLPDVDDLADYPDNIRQLEALARAGLLSDQAADDLKSCYLALRRRIHDLALDGGGRVVDNSEYGQERKIVRALWAQTFG